MAPSLRLLTAALALLFLGAHLRALPRSLEDIDTINLALGVESFDVVEHRPHPPGYPVFVALGKVSTAVLAVVAPGLDRTARAAVALAVWGVMAGGAFAWLLVSVWRTMGWPPLAAWFAAALAIGSPLFWFTSARPLTDAAALVAATAVQWIVVRHGLTVTPSPVAGRMLYAAALAAGLAIGLRTQTLWLTAPLLTWAAARALRHGRGREAATLVAMAAIGCLLWAVPLVASTGGLDRYLTALAEQGREDFAGVEMLATAGDRRLVIDALTSTFIRPWRVLWLGQLMSALALAGLARLVWRDRPTCAIAVVAFVPYVMFHLVFQETETVRYALPVVVPMAGLATYAMFGLPAKAAVVLASLVTVATLVTAQPSLSAYGRIVPPTFRAFQEAEAAARGLRPAPLVVAHTGMRRVADWYRPEWPELPVMGSREPAWLHIVEHFRGGSARPVWLLADRRRTDIVLFDPRSRRVRHEYLQDAEVRRLIGQARQDEVRWWELTPPEWMLGRGWALSVEVGGITVATGRDPALVPAEAYVRRTARATRVMIGGRYLEGTRPVAIVAEVEGRPVSRWEVTPSAPSFLYFVDLPAGLLEGAGPYATMQVRVEAGDGSGDVPRVGLEQFSFAAADDVMFGFSEGWGEPETDIETGRSWRWAGPRATMVAYAGSGPVRLTLQGESPLRYFDRPSAVVVLVEGREASRFTASGDFTQTIELPADRFTVSPSRITIETDQVFVPAVRGETPDRRQLSQRFFAVTVERP